MRSILIEKPGSFEIVEMNQPIPDQDEILVEVNSGSISIYAKPSHFFARIKLTFIFKFLYLVSTVQSF